jgi:hypothetical protein
MRSGRDRVGVRGSHARCGRSYSAAAASGSARRQRDRAWRTSEAVKRKAADEIKRHCGLLAEDMEMAPVRPGFGSRGGRGGECGAAKRRRRSGLNWTSASASVERKRSARGGGRPIRMASQLAEKAAELQLVRARVTHRSYNQLRWPCK